MKKYLIIALLFSACTITPAKVNSESKVFFDKFKVEIPFEVKEKYTNTDGKIFLLNFPSKSWPRDSDDIVVNMKYSPSKKCTTDSVASSKAQKIENIDSFELWGKIDYYEFGMDLPADTENFCQPSETSFAYGFCSEKINGESAFICVQQQIDTPKLAEEIFSSFQWVK